MKEELAKEASKHNQTVAFCFCGRVLFGMIGKIDMDAKMATIVSHIPNEADLCIPIESLIGYLDTARLMQSPIWRDRFLAEYIQVTIRKDALARFIELKMTSDIPAVASEASEAMELMKRQFSVMTEYQEILRRRAELEQIEI